MKTWGEIRTETLNLGFEKIKSYNKNKQAYIDAYNWRQALIASVIGGVLSDFIIECLKKDTVQIFDLEKISEKNGEIFISLSHTGIVYEESGRRVDGIYITDNRYMHVPPGTAGKIKVSYYCMPPVLDMVSDDDTQCALPAKWANIMPYLMASRLYLDDDAGKAGYYWNLFVEMKDSIIQQENKGAVSVTGGIDIDGWCDI